MLVSYPAIFYYCPEEDGYYINFPDIEGAGTQGDSIEDALYMASEYLGIMASSILENGGKLPKKSNINEISVVEDFPFKDEDEFVGYYDLDKSFISLVYVELDDYFGSQELIKKTLSIPKWTNDFGKKMNLNFSKLLTDAIINIASN